MGRIILPSTIKRINKIDVDEPTNIVIPSTVEALVPNCFKDCIKLQSIIIPETIKAIL